MLFMAEEGPGDLMHLGWLRRWMCTRRWGRPNHQNDPGQLHAPAVNSLELVSKSFFILRHAQCVPIFNSSQLISTSPQIRSQYKWPPLHVKSPMQLQQKSNFSLVLKDINRCAFWLLLGDSLSSYIFVLEADNGGVKHLVKARDHLLAKTDNPWNNSCILTVKVENWSLGWICS